MMVILLDLKKNLMTYSKENKMNVLFSDSFTKSLKRLIWHRHPVYKFYELFRYKLPQFFKNVWFFRKQLWGFRSWDYSYNLQFFGRTLEKTVNTIEYYGHEVDESRMKKVEKMKRVIELINNIRTDSYIEKAEKEIGELKHVNFDFEPTVDNPELFQLVESDIDEREHNRKVYELSDEIEAQEWEELFSILKGQNMDEYRKLLDSSNDDEKRDLWDKWFDGSGMKHWWD
jgi:hypothetical protein